MSNPCPPIIQVINVGGVEDDGTGDPARDAFDKCNENFAAILACIETLGAPVGPITTILDPIDPIIGTVATVGNATHPAFIQLLNPPGSGVKQLIRRLQISRSASFNSNTVSGRVTPSPIDLTGGANNVGALIHSDEASIAPIHAILTGNSDKGVIVPNTGPYCFAPFVEGSTGWGPTTVVAIGDFPLEVLPGSAVEFSFGVAGQFDGIRMYVMLDEVTFP